MNTIQGHWEEFCKMTIPSKASEKQKEDMRRVFYAGVGVTLKIQNEMIGPSISEDAGVEMLKGLHEEFARFAAGALKGEA